MENLTLKNFSLNDIVFDLKEWGINHGIPILIILITALIATRILRSTITRFEKKFDDSEQMSMETQKRAKTITGLLNTTVTVVIYSAAVLMVVTELGIAIGPLLAGAGIAGLAIGFGAQSLVKDVITGFFILLEDQIRVGDVVEIAGKAGLVESVNLRTTRLRDVEGKVYIIPNGVVDVVTNFTKDWSRALIEIGVAYKEDVDNVISILEDVGESLRTDPAWNEFILEPMTVQGLDSFGDSSVNIRMFFKTIPLKQWDVAREFKRRVKKIFDEKGIEIPFPHVTLYMGEAENTGKLKIQSLDKSPDN
jgi:small conductance mechanosensitive channel